MGCELPVPGLLSSSVLPLDWGRRVPSSKKLIFGLRTPNFEAECAPRAAKVLNCPDLEPSCAVAALPPSLLQQESGRHVFLTLETCLTQRLSWPNLRAQHKTSSSLMAESGVCGMASKTHLLIDSELKGFIAFVVQR